MMGAEEAGMFPTLTYQQRMMGFMASFVMGVFFTLLALVFLPVITLVPRKFALCLTMGNVFALFSTGFLVGPAAQVRGMLHESRVWASGVYVASVVATLYASVVLQSVVATLVCVVVELGSLFWYSISYIPLAQRSVRAILGRVLPLPF